MAKKKVSNDYPFYQALREFYSENKGKIRKHFKEASKKILDFNDKEKNPRAFLRVPQFQALEMYKYGKQWVLENKTYCQSLDEYGKSWALTRKELENEKD